MAKKQKAELDYEALAKLFSLLANPVRLQIMDYLLVECCKRTEGSCSVTDIYTELKLPQPLISKHLKILKESSVLDYNRQGNKILYSFAPSGNIKYIQDFIRRIPTIGKECCS
jgi:DNA-binding transcriptional ArsR family regulator